MKKFIHNIIIKIFAVLFRLRKNFKKSKNTICVLTEEFYHEDLRGFGGYGRTIKYLTEYFNKGKEFNFKVFLTYPLSAKRLEVKRYHNADVLIMRKSKDNFVLRSVEMIKKIHSWGVDLFLSVDFFGTYTYPLRQSPLIPLIVWNKDPRSKEEWARIYTLALEVQVMKKKSLLDFFQIADDQKFLLQELMKESLKSGRKIIFVSEADFIFKRARKLYGLPEEQVKILRKVVELPIFSYPSFSSRPSFLFLGRLDPIKRPWIYFELAKKFPGYDFFVGGETHFPEVMDRIISQYNHLKNLHFLGRIGQKKKNEILGEVWGLINTSIHEALPVTFVEALSHGKLSISSQEYDEDLRDFGFSAGEILGEGLGEDSLNKFAVFIERLVSMKNDLPELGLRGREFVEQNFTFDRYAKTLSEITRSL